MLYKRKNASTLRKIEINAQFDSPEGLCYARYTIYLSNRLAILLPLTGRAVNRLAKSIPAASKTREGKGITISVLIWGINRGEAERKREIPGSR